MSRTRQDGFTLTELLVAMLVTMVVSGAVFGLMASGQGAFRREPALTERQQNIRVAMDMIQRDIAKGGAGMPVWQQVFSPTNLDNATPLNGQGPQGVNTGAAGRTDHLQIFGNDGECPDVPTAPSPGPPGPTDGSNLNMLLPMPGCYSEDQMVLITYADGSSGWGFAHEIHADDDAPKVNFPTGRAMPGATAPGTPPWPQVPLTVSRIQLVRYEIVVDATDGVPGLWRSETGGFTADNEYKPAPEPTGGWQLIARGIEDLQVRYRLATDPAGTYGDTPPVVTKDNFATLTRDVEVTLWARAIGPNLQGGTVAPGQTGVGRIARRGSMVSVITPRAVLMALREVPAGGPGRWQ